ncbi:MAG: endo alpha-1,4 polygalactosaminidase [Hyphomicrobiaceae bacterium]|nr:endo alpha-1,4 polygalactosaminidase [Hyphomicrobiaceae bacterium]
MSRFTVPLFSIKTTDGSSRVVILTAVVALAGAVAVTATPAKADREAVKSAKSWSYQLAGDMRSTARNNADVAVVDPDHTGNPGKLKTKANGGKRAVLAYISIGEVEEGRAYMKSGEGNRYNTGKTQGWKGNYAARYWDDGWKDLVKSRVRKALAAGYDGVYLDRVDTYETVKGPKGGRAEMIDLVKEVSREARSSRGNAAVVVQNGEELLTDKSYVAAIDGVAKESLYYGVRGSGVRNSDGDIRESKKLLKNAKDQGKAVYVVEYLSGETSRKAKSESARDGYVGNTKASRALEKAQGDDD